MLGRRDAAKKGLFDELTPPQKQTVLESLAWRMMVDKTPVVSRADAATVVYPTLKRVTPKGDPVSFLGKIEEESGLLIEPKGDFYAFVHGTIREFLAACHVRRNPKLAEVLVQFVDDDWWWECLRLYSATGDATPVLQACINYDPPRSEVLALAIECSEEASEVDLPVRNELESIVKTGLRPVTEAMLKLRVSRMNRVDENRFIDHDLVTHSEYQLFLDELRVKGDYRQPDHWTETHYVAKQGREPVIGLRFSDAQLFCEWLTERAVPKAGPWRFRLPTDSENETIDPQWKNHEVVPWRLAGAGSVAVSQFWPLSLMERQTALVDRVLEDLQDFEIILNLEEYFAGAATRARSLRVDGDLYVGRAQAFFGTLRRLLARFLAGYTVEERAKRINRGREEFLEALAHARSQGLRPDLDRDHAYHFDVAQALALVQELALQDSEAVTERPLERNPAPPLARALDLDYDKRVRDFVLPGSTTRQIQARSLTFYLAHALLVIRAEMVKVSSLLANRNIEEKMKAFVRKEFLLNLYEFLYEYSRSISILWLYAGNHMLETFEEAGFPGEQETRAAFHKITDDFVSCCLSAAFKRARIKGESIPFEGLRLVRELTRPVD